MTQTALKTPARPEAGSKKHPSYRRLQTQFQRDGFSYRQIAREGAAAIYEQSRLGIPNPSVCYEVIRIRRRGGFYIHGRHVEPAETYPNAESWGVDGWTLTDRDAAFAKLREMARISRCGVEEGEANETEKSPTRRKVKKIVHKTLPKIAHKTA